MFKITQLFENSNKSDNLCLSGIELYGFATGKNWMFWILHFLETFIWKENSLVLVL